VRSVLNNIWSLFNEAPVELKNKPVGTLLTLDMLFDMIGSSVDSDVLLTLHRLFDKTEAESMERKVAKAIALLEMNGDARPVTDEMLTKLLYPALGSRGVKNEVEAALNILKRDNWIQYSEKSGWSVQNNAAQEWNRQKSEISVTASEIDELLRELSVSIVEPVAQPVYPRLGVRFPLSCFWGTDSPDDRFSGRGEPTAVSVCFHWVTNQGRRENAETWLDLSRDKKTMIHWVSGDTSNLESLVRDWKKSSKMIARFRGQSGLTPVQSRLLVIEQGNADSNRESLKKELRTVWTEGCLYFDGGREEARVSGTGFETALKAACESRIERIYHSFEPGNVHLTPADFDQLLKRDTGGLSRVFLDGPGSLGLARSDGGKIVIKPEGIVPQSIYSYIKIKSFDSGERIFAEFAGPPYGWSRLVIKSAVVALLRDEKVKFDTITSITDPDARKIFDSDREFGRAEIETRIITDGDLSGRDRNAMQNFFEKVMHLPNVDNSLETLADLVFQKFPHIKDQVASVERTLTRLGLQLPQAITELNSALTECLSNRLADTALRRLKAKLPVLEAGYPQLLHAAEALSEGTVRELSNLIQCLDVEASQLAEIDDTGEILDDIESIRGQFSHAEPWKGYADVKSAMDSIKVRYRTSRERLAREEQTVLELVLSSIKSRTDFGDLEREAQDEVLGIVTSAYKDIDGDAVEPRLVSLSRLPVQIREAGDRAQRRFDQLLTELHHDTRVRVMRSGLRYKTFANEAELDGAITELREKCRDVFASGDTVRFEE
jgi:hypothetical protein